MRLLVTLCLLACVAVVSPACSRGASYELRGQILAVDAARQELTIKHGDIKGFMPGMTMPFKVKDAALMDGRTAGDLVRATLVVEDSLGYLSAIEVTGHAPVTEPLPPRPMLDLIDPGQAAPDVGLIDQDGARRRLSDWRGRVVVVTFIYTRCPLPDFCPLMDKQFAAVQRAAAADPQLKGDGLHLVSVSIDPAFDTPAVLQAHAGRANARPDTWSFVTGTRDEIEHFASRFGVSVIHEDPSSAEVVHNLRTAVIDPQGRLTKVFGGNEWTVDELLAEIRRAATAH